MQSTFAATSTAAERKIKKLGWARCFSRASRIAGSQQSKATNAIPRYLQQNPDGQQPKSILNTNSPTYVGTLKSKVSFSPAPLYATNWLDKVVNTPVAKNNA
jgi:hypothetical protein